MNHYHGYGVQQTTSTYSLLAQSGGVSLVTNATGGGSGSNSGTPSGSMGTETRPFNYSVYYYIKT